MNRSKQMTVNMLASFVSYIISFGISFFLSPYDSCFTALKHQGFFWMHNTSINYRPCILPRSQDMAPMIEETTGLYGMSRSALEKYRCRIGAKPYIHFVDKFEAVDINTEEDLKMAEFIGKEYWHY